MSNPAEIDDALSVFESAAVVTVQPGDVLLFRSSGVMRPPHREAVVDMLNEVFPANESIILEGGQDIAVLRPRRGLLAWLFGRT